MSAIKKVIAGFAGAIVLNIIHESLKKTSKNMPRIDLLGEEALQGGLQYLGTEIPDEEDLYFATLGADLISNGMYYSLIGGGPKNEVWAKAITLGLLGGAGAVILPKHMGLNDQPVAKNNQVKALTVGYYLTGALATAAIYNLLRK